ncbi:hypothetical protein [Halodesulfovibrio aestuarii]|uniref:Uncharacterized protein n=1 Tax=Halodesulfovibrio aestuarii TaxID=126333 RepID=A0A8G2FH00_9BACT|nr:hypothetical protein [Halodesulfovibrio aestuarii]SHI71729.1 hypothetical protein SAMN05660830_00758 [Halodesulfovibrio aestuarii]
MSSERLSVTRGDITINGGQVVIINKHVAQQVQKAMDEKQQGASTKDDVIINIEIR